ncbi:TadE/TadG family type IV pilus assembly protein [Roseovarius sp. EL26]|uniref:TadE/TadG family type IV pilus assembly protein n=1 Tax=Roseovarius sp. EL26 TaxID=2126672 RepID=UPI000EA0FC9B|nr:TadE/TadG family type IV pilus assembly protein [Roseovarius sp. EL26]
MISQIKSRFLHLRRKEDGNASVEFFIIFPIYLSLLFLSIELGLVTMRHAMLERGLDVAVRDIRLGTGTFAFEDPVDVNGNPVLDSDGNPVTAEDVNHARIVKSICDNAIVLRDCHKNLILEMVPNNIRTYTALGPDTECRDKDEDANPAYTVVPGQENELMMLRACLRYDPLFPEELLGRGIADSKHNGQALIIAMSTFVQEPR